MKSLAIHSIEVDNFKAFKQPQKFQFGENLQTLNFVTGDNQVEPDLGQNGCAKSTLFTDALCFALYGKSTRGLKASNVANWESDKGCRVSVDVTLNGEALTITRRWNPNDLYLTRSGFAEDDHEDITQTALEDKLGMSFEAFTNFLVVGQFSSKFFDMRPGEKMDLFTSILGDNLNFWISSSEQASKYAEQLASEIAVKDKKEGVLQADIAGFEDRIKEREELEKEWVSEREEERHTIESNLKKAQEEKEDFENELEVNRQLLDDFQQADFSDKIKELNATLEEHLEEQSLYQEELGSISGKLDDVNMKLGTIEDTGEGNCPKCFQVVTKEHLESVKEELAQTKETFQAIKQTCEECLDEAKEDASRVKAEIENLSLKQHESWRERQQIQSTIERLGAEIENSQSAIDSYNTRLKKLKEKTNPHVEVVESMKAELWEKQQTLHRLQEDLNDDRRDHADFSYWVKAFKQIRLNVIQNALHQFEIHINNCLDEVGLVGWKVLLDVERQTKSGNVSKGFTTYIQSPHNKEAVPWEAWSGGESQRLRLAGNMGLIDLLEELTGFTTNLEIWDEGSAHLSNTGVDQFLELLRKRANTKNKQIWLIEHRGLDYGYFDRVVNLVKTEEGIEIHE